MAGIGSLGLDLAAQACVAEGRVRRQRDARTGRCLYEAQGGSAHERVLRVAGGDAHRAAAGLPKGAAPALPHSTTHRRVEVDNG